MTRKPSNPNARTITQTDAAKRLGVSRVTVRKALTDGRLDGVRSIMNPARFIGVTVESIEHLEHEYEQARA